MESSDTEQQKVEEDESGALHLVDISYLALATAHASIVAKRPPTAALPLHAKVNKFIAVVRHRRSSSTSWSVEVKSELVHLRPPNITT